LVNIFNIRDIPLRNLRLHAGLAPWYSQNCHSVWTMMANRPLPGLEWQTFAALIACYGVLALSTVFLPTLSPLAALLVTAVAIAFHSSLQHEALHGHPTRNAILNELLVFPAVGLFVPYRRFRDTHLAHHHDEILTDPYDDPESNFLDPSVWAQMPALLQIVYRINNTLAGRMLLGPMLSIVAMLRMDLRLVEAGTPGILLAYILHAVGLVPVVWWLTTIAAMPAWHFVLAAYLGFSLLKIRTYLEHRAHETPEARTVIIEDRGPLALLFLNNNYHVVHHTHPGRPWYRMQSTYYADPDKYRSINGTYIYPNYWSIIRQFLFRAKDPVPHPIWRGRITRV
jgi:fatty acid desaturase